MKTQKWLPYVAAFLSTIAVTLVFLPLRDFIGDKPGTVGFAEIILVILISSKWGTRAALVASTANALSWNYFFLRPYDSFSLISFADCMLFVAFLITSIIVGQLSARAKRRAEEAEMRQHEIARLYVGLQQENSERKNAEAALRKSQEELELRVQQRTCELKSCNQQLELEVVERKRAEAVLELLASQAAISLDNTQLYTDLREREGRIRHLVESNIIGVFFWDLHGGINEANEAFLRMLGYSRDDLLARKIRWTEITPPPYRALDEQKVAEVRRTGSCMPYEKEYLHKDGRRIPVLIGSALYDDARKQGVAFVLDLNEHRQAETEPVSKNAEAANAAKSTFLANMSHELRSPLNTLLGFARLMERQPALPRETKEDLAIILRSGEHLRTLINQVLDLAKIEAGQAALNETDFDLHAMLDELEDMFALKSRDHGLALHFEQDNIPHFVRGDPLKLRQVLINLIGNALKFTRQGQVTVRIARSDTPAGLRFAVTDSGPGIAAEELHDLLNPFVQTRTGQQTQEGTGLGLTISRNFVRLMGGTLHIDSQLGRGTTVSFALPLQAVEAVTMASQPDRIERQVTELAPGQPRYRILAADDRQEARQLLVRLLTPLGFEVREAANGQEALEIWEAWQPHLIWMDMRMPVLDGREATRRIKASASAQPPVIIALTASSFEEERAEILASGCDDFLRKPFQEADLFGLMQKHLGVRFTYQEELAGVPSAAPLDSAALAALPEALRHTLEQALIQLDTAAVANAIAAVPDASLAHALAVLADEFQYNRMLHLIQDVDRKEQA